MEAEVAAGKFIESATFSGNMYGMFSINRYICLYIC